MEKNREEGGCGLESGRRLGGGVGAYVVGFEQVENEYARLWLHRQEGGAHGSGCTSRRVAHRAVAALAGGWRTWRWLLWQEVGAQGGGCFGRRVAQGRWLLWQEGGAQGGGCTGRRVA